MALKKTASGKIDKRTAAYKEMVARAKNARKGKSSNTTIKKKSSSRKANGSYDLRTKEGKAVAERMAKARKAKNSWKNKLKKLFK
ncbi:hypothetical protein BPO_1636 [Bergeyella porcorum]|uniref:Plasmid stabilization protein n=1 Tax=Bergeyella porcorum TaxID=1735111 RepID=A0AAU0F4M8_9FLAO